jgi:hypothetical protein
MLGLHASASSETAWACLLFFFLSGRRQGRKGACLALLACSLLLLLADAVVEAWHGFGLGAWSPAQPLSLSLSSAASVLQNNKNITSRRPPLPTTQFFPPHTSPPPINPDNRSTLDPSPGTQGKNITLSDSHNPLGPVQANKQAHNTTHDAYRVSDITLQYYLCMYIYA